MQSRSIVALGALLAMPTLGYAQTATEAQPETPLPQAAAPAPEAMPAEPAPELGSLGIIAEQAQDQMLASELIGAPVMNAEGNPIGSIEDLIVDADDRLVGVVVGVGGFLAIGKHAVGVEADKLTLSAEGVTVALGDELQAAPAFRTLAAIEAEREAELLQQQQQQAVPPPALPQQ